MEGLRGKYCNEKCRQRQSLPHVQCNHFSNNRKHLKCQTIVDCLSKLWHFHSVLVNKMMCLNNLKRWGKLMIQILGEKRRMQHYISERPWHCKYHSIIESIWKKSYQYAYICVGRVYMWLWLPPFRFSCLICKLPHRPCPNNKTQKGGKANKH